ncbi:DUF5667 domain-containing protein [Kitasatospora sp. RB6PN24]|uniref:DUF5667 domain-containing protein n=1 Tax=Kitasatospora humi TaxID=2893891 RepID=UPI001E446519|nr:DUF5667 domain-containing protein [Kitasatospora humi]MCC9311629.1 DUF5667 domain-containing protein [Kitasatospora humi]
MTANVLEHRRAKAFAEALEAHRTGQAESGAPMGGLLDTATALSALSVPGLDAEVRVVQRAQLMAAFEQAVGGGLATVPRQRGRRRLDRPANRRRWGRRFAITGMIAGVTVGSLAGVAAASSDALPGDPLYGMKRHLEGLRLDLADNDAERGALLLDQASTRLAEARGLVGRTPVDGLSPETVSRLNSALRDMHAEAAKGRDLLRSVYRANGSLDPLRKLAAFTETQDDHWNALQSHLPTQLTPVAGQVDQLFGDLNQEVGPLQHDSATGHPVAPSTGSSAGSTAPGSPAAGARPEDPTQGSGAGQSAGATRPGGGSPAAGQGLLSSSGGQGGRAGQGGNPVGGLVNGLAGTLTGGNASPAASSAPAGGEGPSDQVGQADTPAAAPAAPSSNPAGVGQTLNLPPLIPGLLPGLGLDGKN